jgi:hypothetical protein
MATGFEAALVKPLVDALIGLYKKAKTARLKASAETTLSEVIRQLLQIKPDLNDVEVKIAVAKAAGIINKDLLIAEDMCSKYKVTLKKATASKKTAPKKATASKKTAVRKYIVKKFAR